MRKMLIAVLVLVGVVVAAVVVVYMRPPSPHVGDRAKLERTFTADEQRLIDTRRVTAGELARHDGKDGCPAWIAVNGVVYDMSTLNGWKGGRHHGVQAGVDATESFVKSAHAVAKLQMMTVVGAFEAPR